MTKSSKSRTIAEPAGRTAGIEKTGAQKITPCLWFDGNAEEAVDFYASIFPSSRIVAVMHYGPAAAQASGQPEGSVMTIVFRLAGQEFMALNGGPAFKFSPAISLMVNCETQEELDELWDRLSEGGQIVECGWLTDKFGLSWQIVPRIWSELLSQGDPEKSERVMQAMLQMKKLDIATFQQAYEQE